MSALALQDGGVINDFREVMDFTERAHFRAIVNDWCDQLPHIVKLKRNFNTACWTFANNKHHIYIGDSVYHSINQTADKGAYISAFMFHEMAHARYTSRNLKALNGLLHEKSIPFRLLNLFEDARIEDLWRKDTRTLFNWVELMEPLKNIDSPISIYYALIHNEGDFYEPELPHYERVVEYYNRTLRATSTEALIPVLADFIDEFNPDVDDIPETGIPASGQSGEPKGDESGDSGQNDGDLSHALEVSINGELGDMDDDCEIVSDGASDENDKKSSASDDSVDMAGVKLPANGDSEIKDNQDKSDLDHDLLLSDSVGIDAKSATKHAMHIKKLFEGKIRPLYTDKPSKRFNKRHFGNSACKPYRRNVLSGQKRLELTLIIDCSGSMAGLPMQNAREIVSVFNRLCLMGVFKGRVILSEEYQTKYPVLHLPLSDGDIGKIANTGCGEGLERCMRSNLSRLVSSDHVFVITDGRLCDGEIDKGYYQSKGIYTVGLYANEQDVACDLTKWFDVGVVRSDLDSLFSAMANFMRKS